MQKTVGVVSLGCSKNRVDTEQMLGLLRREGYEIVSDPKRARVIIVNTCGFIASAKEESINTILEMAEYKKTGNCEALVVTGCLSQRYGGELRGELPEIDAMLGVNQYARLPQVLRGLTAGGCPMHTAPSDTFFEGDRVLTTPSYSAYVKIGDGCDNRCSFCAIPLIRGGYRSRPREAILEETQKLVSGGVREISLVAQDTTRYGTDTPPGDSRLAELLQETAQVPGLTWLRALYCYPARVDERLLDAMCEIPQAAPYIDLPIQHIVPRLLEAMHRHGTAEHIREVVRAARVRGMTLRTSIIVGFPGETQADFEELLAFIGEARFDRLGAFAFSPEEDTPAYDMPGQVDEEEKQRRLDELMRLQQRISLEANQRRVGEEAEVLVEGTREGLAYGRSQREAPEIDGKILFPPKSPVRPGEFRRVRVTQAQEYDLVGEEA